jgi:hypothetical protein
MSKIEKSAEFILNNTNVALIAYNERGSTELTASMHCDYIDLIGSLAHLIGSASMELDVPVKIILADLNNALKLLEENKGGDDE